ncbi:MAG: arginine--tRNA ligase, partial [bacterium]|nr:arginine--tRNA ligase [bacterium]
VKKRQARGYVPTATYLLEEIRADIAEAIATTWKNSTIHLSFINREKLGGDIAVRLTSELQSRGAKEYIAEVVPKLAEILGGLGFKTTAKGIYVNITLEDEVLQASLESIHALADMFGWRDDMRGQSAVCEFSAPNAAKHLHAGHIRSTIVGEALSRIYEAVGYTVHRTNHINDWGGFGAILEGYERWKDEIQRSENKNDELYQVYIRFRELEKTGGEEYVAFKEAADRQFAKLEAGDPDVVATWERMIEWSIAEFNEFYSLFTISFDYSPGESFYAQKGKELVEQKHQDGHVVHFTDADALRAKEALDDALQTRERERREEEIQGKVGAWVVPVEGKSGSYFVVKRADGGSMYATRDIAALLYRKEVFNAQLLSYVVGVEQTEYLHDLFAVGKQLGVYDSSTVVQHVPIGLYVSKETGKKLSSREGAHSVMDLLARAQDYFKAKYHDRAYAAIVALTAEEIEVNAKKLAIGSVVFNDLRKEHTLPVELSSTIEVLLAEFEESGGAYIMYALARARAILRKAHKEVKRDNSKFAPIEREIIKKMHELPEMVARAASSHNAAIIGNYVLELARDYNSYYAGYPVLDGEVVAYPHRLAITSAVAQCIANCLHLLNIDAPDIL